jgi:hypothetical protein
MSKDRKTAPYFKIRIFKSRLRRRIAQSAFFVAIVGAALSICAAVLAKDNGWLKYGVAAFWTLGPPFYFCFEYYFLFDNWENRDAVEELKSAQVLFFQCWAGVAAFLAALYYG